MTKPHKRITNREFKLLIKPQGLDRFSRITALDKNFISFVERLWIRMGDSPWHRGIQHQLEPISIG